VSRVPAAPVAAPGEVVLEGATRWFSIRADQAGTIKGLLIGKRNSTGPKPVAALQDVTLRIAPGETVGVVGRNGAGKTSTLRVLAGIIPLQRGVAACGGRTVALLELAAGFSRDFSGRENVYLQGALYGLTKRELDARIDQIIAFSELGDFIEVPVKTYSQGMLLRLGFSIAAHLDPDVMLIDEVLAVGDEGFQRKCLRRISEQIATGTTIVLVSHDPGAIERVCERVVVLEAGHVVFDGPTAEGLLHYHRLMGTDQQRGESVRPPGRRSVKVAEVELHDELDRASSVFRSGQPMQIHVGLRAAPAAGEASVRLEVRLSNGTQIFATTSPAELSAEGSARLVFEIADLALLGGDYDLVLGAAPRGQEVLPERTIRFSVAHSEPHEGVVDLRGAWRSLAGARELS
jgi:ABC-type polysaccharide/polyol phosphate transport system ATPase subunit